MNLFLRAQKTIDEATRDKLLGTYYILLDESSKSLFNIPHLILIPVKLIGWIGHFIYPGLNEQSANGTTTKFATLFDGLPGRYFLPDILVISSCITIN